MKYIDLFLKDIASEDYKQFLLTEVIQNSEHVIIILGSPGSGKTSLLKKFAQENQSAQYYTIKDYIKLNKPIYESSKYLLLDALDEYRSTEDDKSFVTSMISDRIKNLKNTKIIITCREMDWYGDTDHYALQSQLSLNDAIKIYRVQPLYYDQIIELAEIYGIENSTLFFNRFFKYGFLSNPQMLVMMAEMFSSGTTEKIKFKRDIYMEFIKQSKEKNEQRIRNKINISPQLMINYVGYLACYYVFSDVFEFDSSFLEAISDFDAGYNQDDMEKVVNTSLFSEKTFVHKTIAEFACANHLVQNLKGQKAGYVLDRIKALFVINGKVPTKLRGTYAWVCSLSQNEEFIRVDPYYQCAAGDNSFFDAELKKRVVQYVKEYSERIPYFADFSSRSNLENFYEPALDNLLTVQLNNSVTIRNNYVHFLISILENTEVLSAKMVGSIKKIITKADIPKYIRNELVDILKDCDTNFLLHLLDSIVKGEIADTDNDTKNKLLLKLYPDNISIKYLVQCIVAFSRSDKFQHLDDILNKTAYDNKFELVKELIRNEGNIKYLSGFMPDSIEDFISDFIIESILKYPDALNAINIFNILKTFDSSKKYNLRSAYFHNDRQTELDNKKGDLQALAAELFDLYLKDTIECGNEFTYILMIDFRKFFNLASPDNIASIILKNMTSELNRDSLAKLLKIALDHLPYDENGLPILNQDFILRVEELGLQKDLQVKMSNYGTIKKTEPNKFELQRALEDEDFKHKNEELFASLDTDDKIINKVDLVWIANLFYFDRDRENKYLEPDTNLRLKNLMKSLVYRKRIFTKEVSLSRLAKRLKEDWDIDKIYYTSASLNDPKALFDIPDNDFLSYLYMLSVINHVTGNIIKNDLHNQLDEYDAAFALVTIKKYLRIAIKKYIPEATGLFNKYIFKSNNLEAMKYIVSHFFYDARNGLLDNLFKAVGFNIPAKDLLPLKELQNINDDLIHKIDALIAFSEKSATNFTQAHATSLFGLLQHNDFVEIGDTDKLKLVDYMMCAFNTPKSIKHTNGIQSPWQLCGSFVSNDSLKFLPNKHLPELLKKHNSEDDIWKNRILGRIDDVKKEDADKAYKIIEVEKLKKFVNSGGVVNNMDFFEDVYLKINALKHEIENNRNNEKDPFYDSNGTPKKEEPCRDEILRALGRYYGNTIAITKEQHEANNRVDMNLKLIVNLDFEVQVECKKDNNKDLYHGVKSQLIDKYMNGCNYGIYLIFYFGSKSMKNNNMLKHIKANIPDEYNKFVKVIYIDLTYK